MITYTMPSTLVTVKCITMETTTKRNGYSKCVCKRGKSEAQSSSKTERVKKRQREGAERQRSVHAQRVEITPTQ